MMAVVDKHYDVNKRRPKTRPRSRTRRKRRTLIILTKRVHEILALAGRAPAMMPHRLRRDDWAASTTSSFIRSIACEATM